MKLTIDIDLENKKAQSSIDEPIAVTDMLAVLFSVQLQFMKSFIDQIQATDIPEDKLKTLKEDLYDKYNAGASNVLYLYMPDEELHPDLTVEAMKAAEDKYMYNQLNREARREVDKKTKKATKNLKDQNIVNFPEAPSNND